ncbi:MAG: exo-beta-N-acetylmuramidase NamZ domain-containing protein, partial [Candidatus Longimicrobiales bacterium M2_2A_002]
MRNFAVATLVLAGLAACAQAPQESEAAESSGTAAAARPGVSVLLDSVPAAIEGRRVGLVTNHTGRDASGTSTIDLLDESNAVELVALYSPEHGIRGVAAPGEQIRSGTD